jgi:hypothetical protein
MSFLRNLDNFQDYEIHKKITRELFGNMEDYVKRNVFDSSFCGHSFKRNRFPYRASYHHWVFWIQPGYEKFYDEERIKKIINKKCKIWLSPSNDKSIFTIKHYQVYLKE